MDDIEKLFRARHNVLDMMKDRGYTIQPELYIPTKEELKRRYYAKTLDFMIPVTQKDKRQPVFVKWVIAIKTKPNAVKEMIDTIQSQYVDLPEPNIAPKIMLIFKTKPNTNILKILKEKEYKGNEMFWLNNLVINITHHFLVPKHEKITEDEVKKLMMELYITNRLNLPIMLKTDPIARYLDLSSGDVVRITRFSPTSGQYFSYRVVK
jgi:DNA-directed RNA polymerase I, II, and III subunit RPABC1